VLKNAIFDEEPKGFLVQVIGIVAGAMVRWNAEEIQSNGRLVLESACKAWYGNLEVQRKGCLVGKYHKGAIGDLVERAASAVADHMVSNPDDAEIQMFGCQMLELAAENERFPTAGIQVLLSASATINETGDERSPSSSFSSSSSSSEELLDDEELDDKELLDDEETRASSSSLVEPARLLFRKSALTLLDKLTSAQCLLQIRVDGIRDGVHCVLNAMGMHSRNQRIQSWGCIMLDNIDFQSQTLQEKDLLITVIERVAHAMQPKREQDWNDHGEQRPCRLIQRTCDALLKLAGGNPDAMGIDGSGERECLIVMELMKHQHNGKVQVWAWGKLCEYLAQVESSTDNLNRKIEREIGIAALQALRYSPDDDYVTQACTQILRRPHGGVSKMIIRNHQLPANCVKGVLAVLQKKCPDPGFQQTLLELGKLKVSGVHTISGVTQVLVLDAMRLLSHDEDIQCWGCDVLCFLAELGIGTKLVVEKGGVPIVIAAMKTCQRLGRKVQLRGTQWLSYTLVDSKDTELLNQTIQEEILREGGIREITQAMSSNVDNSHLQREGCQVFAEFSSPEGRVALRAVQLMNAENGIAAVVQAMKCFPKDVRLQSLGCQTLENFAKVCPDSTITFAEIGAVLTAMDSCDELRTHDELRTQESGCFLLHRYVFPGLDQVLDQNDSGGEYDLFRMRYQRIGSDWDEDEGSDGEEDKESKGDVDGDGGSDGEEDKESKDKESKNCDEQGSDGDKESKGHCVLSPELDSVRSQIIDALRRAQVKFIQQPLYWEGGIPRQNVQGGIREKALAVIEHLSIQ